MPAERALLPRDIRVILDWIAAWDAIPTRKQIAHKLGVSEATVTRIARGGGYKPRKVRADIAALIESMEPKQPVPHGTEPNASHQEAVCTQGRL